jgi:hypothetical protein
LRDILITPSGFAAILFDIVTATNEIPATIHLDDPLITRGLNEMIDSCDMIFIPEWEAYPLRQHQVLSLLSEKGPLRRIASLDLAEYNMTHTSFNSALKELLRKGALREDEMGNYRVTDPIFRRWIARRGGSGIGHRG